ncbi:MAG: hypothetical protein HC880_03265 [Bacteroidia bacterium]|nr:hypothetical protein [Bacteroidia bacterium]
MEQTNKRNFFTTYFQLSFSTIQGRVTLAFFMTVVVMLTIVFMTDRFWRRQKAQQDIIIHQTKPHHLRSSSA